ncbi:MAG: hypothetical protein ACRDZO_12705, partial [Egibacteraceae bacterium]
MTTLRNPNRSCVTVAAWARVLVRPHGDGTGQSDASGGLVKHPRQGSSPVAPSIAAPASGCVDWV